MTPGVVSCMEGTFPISRSRFSRDILCCVLGGLISNFYISASRFGERDKVVLVVFIIHPKISLTTAQSPSPAASLFRLMESFSSHITVW